MSGRSGGTSKGRSLPRTPTQPKPDVCTCTIPFSPSLSSQDRFGAGRAWGLGCRNTGGYRHRRREQRLESSRLKGRVWRENVGSNKSIPALFSRVRVWVSRNGQSGQSGDGSDTITEARTLGTYLKKPPQPSVK